MKYFIDFEFLEGNVACQIKGFNIPKWLIKPNNTIQPISVGICSSDGREYYAISKDFNLKEAWNRYDLKERKDYANYPKKDIGNILYKKEYWIRDNVLKPIWEEKCKEGFSFKNSPMTPYGIESLFTYSNFKKLLNKYGKTNKQIAQEIIMFIDERKVGNTIIYPVEQETETNRVFTKDVNFYAYYADYDWVVFCWLFGKMIDLPTGFPKYCINLKQILDEKVSNMEFRKQKSGDINDYEIVKGSTNLQQFLDLVKGEGLVNGTYPKQINEHNALADARFNRDLFNFLNTI